MDRYTSAYRSAISALAKAQEGTMPDPQECAGLRKGLEFIRRGVEGYDAYKAVRAAGVITSKDHDKLAAYRRLLILVDPDFETETSRMIGAIEAVLERRTCNIDDIAVAQRFFTRALERTTLDGVIGDSGAIGPHC